MSITIYIYVSISICLFSDNCTFASYESEGVCVHSCPEGLVADDDPRVCRNTTGKCVHTYTVNH